VLAALGAHAVGFAAARRCLRFLVIQCFGKNLIKLFHTLQSILKFAKRSCPVSADN